MNDNKKDSRRYNRVARKLKRAADNQKRIVKINEKYGYDYQGAVGAGLEPDNTGHWPSRDPETGKILKGRKHPTIYKTKRAEKELGYKIRRINGRLYSFSKK